jgi:tetratricopeptide (TPR) repeat protein
LPRLPSGREVAIRPERLDKLVKDAWSGRFVHELMMIQCIDDLLAFIDLVELKQIDGDTDLKHDPLSKPEGKQFQQVGNVVPLDRIDLLAGMWSHDDVTALTDFLASDRAKQFLANLLVKTSDWQQKIINEGPQLARLQALWWREGVHPLQEEEEAADRYLLTEHAEELSGQHLGAGCDCEKQCMWNEAIEHYQLALALNPIDPRVRYFGHNNLAYCLLQQGRSVDAAPHCHAAIAINEDQYNAHKNLGLAYEGLGRFSEAALSFIHATRLAPSEHRAWLHLEKLLTEHPELAKLPEVSEGITEIEKTIRATGNPPSLQ